MGNGVGGSAVTVYALCMLSTHRATPKDGRKGGGADLTPCPAELLPSLHHVLTFETVGLPVLLLAAAGAVHS